MWQWKIKKIKLIDLFKKEVKKKKGPRQPAGSLPSPYTGLHAALGPCILCTDLHFADEERFRGFTQLYTEFYLVLSDFQIHVLPTLLNGLYKKVN